MNRMDEAGAECYKIRQANRCQLLGARRKLKDARPCQPCAAQAEQRGKPCGSGRRRISSRNAKYTRTDRATTSEARTLLARY